MKIFEHEEKDQIFPGDREQVYYWTKKWGITDEQLNEAIMETGSIQVRDLKKYLIQKGLIFSVTRLMNQIRGRR